MKICITINNNNIVNGYGIGENSLKNGINIKTDVDFNVLCGNYKYENNELIKLTEEEKKNLFPSQKETQVTITEEQQLLSTVLLENAEIKEQLKEQQELSAALALQIAEIKGGNANV